MTGAREAGVLLQAAVTKVLLGLGGALVAVSASIGCAGQSHAAPIDQEFLERLNSVGITYSNAFGTLMDAQRVCRDLNGGVSHSRVVDLVQGDNPALEREVAADFVVVAYMTYCPWNR